LEWIEENPAEHARLEAMIGCRVALTYDRKTFDGKVLSQGTEFVIFARLLGTLFGRMTASEVVYALKPRWIHVVRKAAASGE
jgi:hypothetical protein